MTKCSKYKQAQADCCKAPRRGTHARTLRAGVAAVLKVLLLAALTSARAKEPLRVIYPQSESSNDARPSYPTAVLRLALEHSGRTYRLQPSDASMQQSRSLLLLAEGEKLDVAWTVTNVQREAALRPVRFPIDFGLIGWRVFLVRRGDSERFSGIQSVIDLEPMVGGQGHDWPDVAVLRSNRLQVSTSATYEGLFGMLVRGHIDYFPRALSEVSGELAARRNLPIELEPRLLLYYPSAQYFFVNPRNDALANALEEGLERSLKDGSLRALFDAEYGSHLAAVGAERRRVISLENPDLPPQTPRARQDLWIEPVSIR